MSDQQLEMELQYFIGTAAYHRFSSIMRNFLLTDGAQHLADNGRCYWLMDLIASHGASYKGESFVAVKVTRKGEGVDVVITDGNYRELAKQEVEYSDFPLDEITLFVVAQDEYKVIMLASEY